MHVLNRSRRARESAGLSLGQAARLLGLSREQIALAEESDSAYADLGPDRLAEIYGVNVEWLSGRCELRDWGALKQLDGGGRLLFRDRDMLAELYVTAQAIATSVA